MRNRVEKEQREKEEHKHVHHETTKRLVYISQAIPRARDRIIIIVVISIVPYGYRARTRVHGTRAASMEEENNGN